MEYLSAQTTRAREFRAKEPGILGLVRFGSTREKPISRPASGPLKIAAIFGTRPEVVKFFPVIKQIEQHPRLQSQVISTSQHREMIDELMALFALRLDHDLNVIQPNQSLADISTRALAGLDAIFKQQRPDLVLVQGDTTTAFIGALAAFYHKIPVGHIEAGLRSHDKTSPYPEEINRRLISTIAGLHFAPTVKNAANLYKEGVAVEDIFVTGNTVIDSLLHIVGRKSGRLSDYLPAAALNARRMILVTAHRRENLGAALENLCHALKDLVQRHPEVHVVYPVHLNPNVRQTVFEMLAGQERIHLLAPLSYEPFVEAMVKAHLIITDSGGVQEEGPSLGKPVLVFRNETERPEGVAAGGVKLVGTRRENVVQETSRLLRDELAYRRMSAIRNPYGDGRAAQRLVQAVLHYFGMGERPDNFLEGAQAKQQAARLFHSPVSAAPPMAIAA
jgi:UDP-N-acetylglucosamine 2-epimerase (non-hydrolysing)